MLTRSTSLALGLGLWLVWCSVAALAGEQGFGPERDGVPVVRARLVVDVDAVALDMPFRAGVLFEMEPDWHIYWRNPGDAGLATELGWKTPGMKTGPLRWPAPEAFQEDEGQLTTYGYADKVLLAQEAHLTAADGEEIELAIDADFLVCKVECIPGRISLSKSLPLEARSRGASREAQELFGSWAQQLPSSAKVHGLTVDAHYSQDRLRPGDPFRAAISLVCEGEARCRGLRSAAKSATGSFVPDELPDVDLVVTGTRRHPFADGLLVTLRGEAGDKAFSEIRSLRGVVLLQGAAGAIPTQVDLQIPTAARGSAIRALQNPWLEPEPETHQTPAISFVNAFLLAMLGGLILNLMPCVLPVLAIKVFGITERAHADRRNVVMQGAAYTLGILATMVALALVVIALREAGTAVGWGFQFQEPIFVAAIAALLTVFALNLFGVFEIGAPTADAVAEAAGGSGLRGSFFEGILAVLLATPCSAPFLGTAVGFAFASSAPVILGIFVAVGLGLAAPFVLITWVPGWARLIPRSGPWMEKLRGVLGFALLATLVWLLWVVGRSVGTDGMSLLLGFLVLLSAGVWFYGHRQRASETGRAPAFAMALIALTVVALVSLPLQPEDPTPGTTPVSNTLAAQAFDPETISSELQAGHPVFVYFTADWCLTCKVNERAVLQNARVGQALIDRGVVAFKADWTRRDEGIRQELARFGRAGVPMYLLYDPRRPTEPRVLPELLTVQGFLDAVELLASEDHQKGRAGSADGAGSRGS